MDNQSLTNSAATERRQRLDKPRPQGVGSQRQQHSTPMFMLILALVVMLLHLAATAAVAGTVRTAETCNDTGANSVQAKIDLSADNPSDPDIVLIPAGDCTWATGVKVTKSLIIKGAGSGAQVPVPASNGALATVSPCPCTILRVKTSSAILFTVSLAANARFRLAHIDFEDAGTVIAGNGTVAIFGPAVSSASSPQVRIDHNKFGVIKNWYVSFNDVVGVADNNDVTSSFGSPPGAAGVTMKVRHAGWDGGTDGHGSYAAATNLGSSGAVYVESSRFIDLQGNIGGGVIDGDTGGRAVVRKNFLQDTQQVVHEFGGPYTRGMRSTEVYGNQFTYTGILPGASGGRQYPGGISIRAGTGIVHSNTINAQFGGSSTFIALHNLRDGSVFWAGACDGHSPWDLNDGVVYDSGTATSGSGRLSLVDSSKSWAANQWQAAPHTAYSVYNVTQKHGTMIGTNTSSNTLSLSASHDGATDLTFNVGDSYQILRATVCLDQPGRGQSRLISGSPPTPTGWVGSALEPVYAVNNTGYQNFTYGEINSASYHIWPNVGANSDYYGAPGSPGMSDPARGSCTGTFNGSCGTGQGTLANRPATCTPNVAYWVTDEGSWDTTKAPNTGGRLYKCTSTNTWTLFYTPYTYPHPLRTSGVLADDNAAQQSTGSSVAPPPAPLQAPTNLKVQ